MRDLPGYYFDAARQRYFPDSSRPKSHSHTIPTQPTNFKLRQHTNHKALNVNALIVQVQRCRSKITRDKVFHSIKLQQVASTSSSHPVYRVPTVFGNSPITSLCITHVPRENGETNRAVFLGDRNGFCYADSGDTFLEEHHLFSEITSVQANNQTVVHTSFGPSPQILVRNVSSSPEAYILKPSYLRDVRAAHLHSSSLIVGMQNMALQIIDLDRPVARHSFVTNSDVFSVLRDNHHVWTGTRNGLVKLFDLRSARDQQAIGASFQHASVVHLRLIHEHQLLVAATDGSIKIFDKRLIRRHTDTSEFALPVQLFVGLVTGSRLGLAVDSSEEFLFAAGDDKRIWAWSVLTGQRLHAPLQTGWNGLLSRVFPSPVLALEVSFDDSADTLWVASGTELECFQLGQRRSQDSS